MTPTGLNFFSKAISGGGDPGPFRGHKGSFFEGGLRVPSIVRWPAVLDEGEVREQFVVGCDWYPTLMEWCGGSLPEGVQSLDGKSIADVIESDAESPHTEFYWTFGRRIDKQGTERTQWALRQGDWKLLGNPKDNVKPLAEADRELFLANWSGDIGEAKNVAKEFPEMVDRMLERVRSSRRSCKQTTMR